MSDQEPANLVDAYARSPIGQGVAWLFAGVTTVLTIVVLLLVPGLGGPVIVVFIPTVTAAVLIALAVLNDGLGPLAAGWVMAAVYGTAALIVVVVTKGRLGQAPGRFDGLLRGVEARGRVAY